MIINEIHDLHLEPLYVETYEIALKNYIIFTIYEEKEIIGVCTEYLAISLDFLSKYDYDYDVKILDSISFEKVYSLTLDYKAKQEMQSIHNEQENTHTEDDDYSLSEFLKIGSDILTSEESAPIIKFVNSLFYHAIKRNASDIHIEVHEFDGEIRYRMDGVLSKHIQLDKKIIMLVISRIKVISNLDISEKRLPQDGRTQIKIAKKNLDIRVSIIPTFYGERVVMRILMQSEDILSPNELGFSKKITNTLKTLVSKSYGMILITGPTGSGKSTTLHSLLHEISSPEKNIITIEDPVEYKSNNISQIQVNTNVGFTFASGLRSILRQDPDIVMVGEIRDKETASISVQAALTGHLLFSTLHTNRAPSAITRLIDMGVEKFLIASSLLAVLAQRLVRQLCVQCKEIDNSNEVSRYFTIPQNDNTIIYKSCGCKECNFTGYKGRIAIGELFVINDKVISALKEKTDDSMMMNLAIENGMVTLTYQLKELLMNGQTSLVEVLRIGIDNEV
jgi:general secretion pathway protein E